MTIHHFITYVVAGIIFCIIIDAVDKIFFEDLFKKIVGTDENEDEED